MKLEVEIEDNTYNRAQELFGDDVDLAVVLGQMLGSILVTAACYPEEFMAVFTGQASPEQRERIDNALTLETAKVLKKAKKKEFEIVCGVENPCCDRRNEYNGFASGPLSFVCPKHCSCHD